MSSLPEQSPQLASLTQLQQQVKVVTGLARETVYGRQGKEDNLRRISSEGVSGKQEEGRSREGGM